MSDSKSTTNSNTTTRSSAQAVADGVGTLATTVKDGAGRVKNSIPEMSTGQKVAAAAALGAAAAAVAGLGTLMQKRRIRGEATSLRLEPETNDGWRLVLDGEAGADAHFATKEESLDAARKLAHESAPSELIVCRSDGSEQTRHQYPIDS